MITLLAWLVWQQILPGAVVISLGTSDTFFAAMDDPVQIQTVAVMYLEIPLRLQRLMAIVQDRKRAAKARNPKYMTLQCFLNGSLAREKVRGFWNVMA